MTIDTDKIRSPKKKEKSIIRGSDGLLYEIMKDGTTQLMPGQDIDKADMKELQEPLGVGASVEGVVRALKKTRKSLKDVDGPDLTKRAKGGMVKKYMGGGSVHKNKKNMITTKGWGASRKT